MENDRLEALISRHFDELLSGEERAELERMLLESPQARTRFWALAKLNAVLRQWGQEEWGRKDGIPAPLRVMPVAHRPVPVRRLSRPAPVAVASHGWWPLAAAAAVAIGFFAWLYVPTSAPLPERGVAVLTHASDVVWGKGNPAKVAGTVLKPGWVRLDSGVLQIEFSRGARVVLEGPAAFCLRSDNSGELLRGKLSAVVPEPAHGFAVRTPGLTVVDHGTKFGCYVPASGAEEVHVFGGLVGVAQGDSAVENISLHANEAVRLAGNSVLTIPADPGAFLDEEELALRDRNGWHEKLVAWRSFSEKFRHHEGLLAYLDFQPATESSRSMPNRSAASPADSAAAIVGSDWVEGRWPGKQALEFKRTDDRVRMNVPGKFASLTMLAWVRVDGLPNSMNALISGEGTGKLGETKWYLYGDGSLGVGIRTATRGHYTQWWHAHSPPVFKDSALGSWTLLATVIDRAAGRVTHFVNGQAISSTPMSVEPLCELGTMEIGNLGYQPQDPVEAVSFQGRIDEVAVLSTPLAAAEIRHIYEQGSPGVAKATAVAMGAAKPDALNSR